MMKMMKKKRMKKTAIELKRLIDSKFTIALIFKRLIIYSVLSLFFFFVVSLAI